MEKRTISFAQEVEILSQVKVSTSIIAAIKINNTTGSMACACNCLSEAMHKNSRTMGDYCYGNFTPSLVEYGTKYSNKKSEYFIRVEKGAEETVLTLVRNTYKYE